MEEIIDATESATGYLVTPLTDNISETDEGYLVIVGCPIARTGWQEYSVKDLPKEAAKALGIDLSNPDATIDLYRPAEEVFAPEFLASLNGKPITDLHPPNFLNKNNVAQYQMGHIQNPRRGGQLEDGEEALIADLYITAEPLISKVRNKTQRDISLGYDYGIRREGKRIIQCDMLGNHNAVVPKGRAGDLVSIQDSAPTEEVAAAGEEAAAPTQEEPRAAPPEPAAASPPAEPSVQDAVVVNETQPNKEKHKVKLNFWELFSRGMREAAKDPETDPGELAQAAAEAHRLRESGTRARAADGAAKDGKAKDDLGDPPDKDVEPAPVDDKRKKMHDALDLMLDKRGKDSDIGELKSLLDEFLSEEEEEPEHASEDTGDVSELEQVIGEETDAEPCPECGEVGDACQCDEGMDEEEAPDEEVVESGEEELEPVGAANDRRGAKDGARSKDRARAADGVMATLKLMRPFVARSNDKAMKNTFNAALSAATRTSRATSGGHKEFAGAARARDKAPKEKGRANDSVDRDAKLQAAYNEAFKKGGK